MRTLNGATGQPVWPSALEFGTKTVAAGMDVGEWNSLLYQLNMGKPGLLRPAPDLNGDGVGDLVWASRTSPSLLAVSGKDGKVLWWFRGRPGAEKGLDMAKLRPNGPGYHPSSGSTIGQPIAADVDGDGTPDVIACFVSTGETFARENGEQVKIGPEDWVEAVSGRTGKSLWRYRMDKRWLEGKYSLNSTYGVDYNSNCTLAMAQVKGQPVVTMVAGRMLVGLSLKTGKEVWPPQDLGFNPLGRPQWADLDGDGQPEVVLLHPKLDAEERSGTTYQVRELVLTVVSLSTRGALWERTFRPPPVDLSAFKRSEPGWGAAYWITEANQGGKREVVIAVGRHDAFWFWDDSAGQSSGGGSSGGGAGYWSGLEVLDGATGKPRWQRPLWRGGRGQAPAIGGLVEGPDLDGDGRRELFVAASGYDAGPRKDCLSFVAVSAADGQVLWRWRQSGSHQDLRPLHWWQAGPDGWPQLLVPVERGPGGQPVTYVVSAGTGRTAHVLPGVSNPEVADFNGDGIPDLFYCRPDSPARLTVIPGSLPCWRQFGQWKPAQDFDRDGFTDFVQPGNACTARSGRDGHILWQSPRQDKWSSGNDVFFSPPLPEGDLNGDGVPDLLHPFSAISGKDGHRLWTASDSGLENHGSGWGSGGASWGVYSYPVLDCRDLDGDGRWQILVAYLGANNTHRLAALSGRDGSLRWDLPIVCGAFREAGSPCPTALKDLDGDGVRDLVLWVPKGGGAELRAFSGKDGSELWPSSTALSQPNDVACCPPAVGELKGDGSVQVVVARRDWSQKEQVNEILALRGRDGQCLWKWSWRGYGQNSVAFSALLPPLLVDFGGDGRRAVCLGIVEKGSPQIVILDSDGKLRQRIPLKPNARGQYDFTDSLYWWGHGDLNGDGKEELLFTSDGKLWACRGGLEQVLWKWPLPADEGRIHEIQPAAKNHAATVVAWSGRTVYGLAGPTGVPRWRCDVQHEFNWNNLPPPSVALLGSANPAGLPRVWTSGYSSAPDGCTVCRQAWAVNPQGQYQAPTPTPMTYKGEPELLPPGRPLPWAFEPGRSSLPLDLLIPAGICLILVVIPGLLVYWTARRHRWALALVLPAFCVVFGTVGLPRGHQVFVLNLGVLTLAVLAVPGQLGYWAVRQKSWLFGVASVCCAALSVVLYLCLLPSDPSRGIMIEWPLLLLGVAQAPLLALAMVFPALLTVWLWRRSWWKAGLLLASSIALAAVIAAVVLLVDARNLEPAESYSWEGWYWIWFPGAYTSGALIVAWLVLKLVFRLVWRGVRRVFA